MKSSIIKIADSLGAFFFFIFNVCKLNGRHPPSWKLIQYQMLNIGVFSLPVVAITGFSTGLVLAAQAYFQFSDKGLSGLTGILVSKSMITELGPVLTAFMVTGRVGAAMCAEIGTMKVTEQIDALQSMSVNPLNYLIGPRFIAGIIMLPLLTIFSCAMGIIGGYLISIYYFGMNYLSYTDPIPLYIIPWDFFSGISKSFIFGIIIISISCYQGLKTTGGAQGVGKKTTQSVVICYSWILIINFLMTIILNNMYELWY
jgi:phospholipid/cholesterol/gamma-HCH transport system permease protein